ncbi:hypothetical protein N0V85_003803 [Neurospora sp. IMI 360204]|nr:hypothetical protein N0V85_003803 [Neurospora sp. IMI 360204]
MKLPDHLSFLFKSRVRQHREVEATAPIYWLEASQPNNNTTKYHPINVVTIIINIATNKMLTIQALSVSLGWLGIHYLPGVSALPGASTIRHVTSNTDATSLIANPPYDVSVPDGLQIHELFHTEVPKNRDDQEEGGI